MDPDLQLPQFRQAQVQHWPQELLLVCAITLFALSVFPFLSLYFPTSILVENAQLAFSSSQFFCVYCIEHHPLYAIWIVLLGAGLCVAIFSMLNRLAENTDSNIVKGICFVLILSLAFFMQYFVLRLRSNYLSMNPLD